MIKSMSLRCLRTGIIISGRAFTKSSAQMTFTQSSARFTAKQLKRAVELCAEADYQMKSSSADDTELLKEVVTRIIAGGDRA